ncbi:SusC/RagA family TonB-linked outer membrane protein [Parapedobacter sp.]
MMRLNLLCLLFLGMVSFRSIAQESEVHGTVTDTSAHVLSGVSVTVKGKTSLGTTTDLNGRYILSVPDNSVLLFSMVGYESQEIAVKGNAEIDVTLTLANAAIDEVVVTGFGSTRKRTDMIGSITSVRPSDLKVPASNLTQALQGRVSGLIGFQRSGEPGRDDADFFIRGIATFGTQNKPLILIDNIESSVDDLSVLQTDDLESFSIMKDATATAIYGARGANGVILVETKKGKEGRARVSVRLENSISQPTHHIELADPVTYMKMHNEAILTREPLQELLYPYEKIDNTGQPGSNPLLFPVTDWRQEIIKPYTMNQRANVNINGGGQLATYYVSGAYTRDNGLLMVDERNNFNSNARNNTFSLLSNVTLNFSKQSKLLVRLNGTFEQYKGPIPGGAGMFRNIMRSNPVLFPAYYPADERTAHIRHIMFGNSRINAESNTPSKYNPYADLMRGYQQQNRSNMNAMLEYRHDFSNWIDGLLFRVMANTTREARFSIDRSAMPFYYDIGSYDRQTGDYLLLPINPDGGREFLDFTESTPEVTSVMHLESTLTYNKLLADKHNIGLFFVYMMRDKVGSGIRLGGRPATLQTSLPFRNIGVSGKATYTYDSRYFAEFNFGYNGTERFARNNRFGFFPSFGVAWTISNEPFFEPLKDAVTNLRVRGTYGIIGNDAIGDAFDRFFYLSEIDLRSSARGYRFGESFDNPTISGINTLRYANERITWERSYQKNLAFELGLFNTYTLNVDLYHFKRTNMLQTRGDLPSTMGLAAVTRDNIGEGESRGVDVQLNFNKSINNKWFVAGFGNFTFAQSKYTKFEEPDYDEPYRSRIGYSFRQQWGYIAERLFVDDEDVLNSPTQSFGNYGAGDIKYRDVNDDGMISTRDMVPIGFPDVPEITYGAGASIGYKGLDVSVFFQGSARESFWINAGSEIASDNFGTAPFINDKQLLKAYADDYWSETNRNIYALWPRLTADGSYGLQNNSVRNTWFLRDASFIRLKQVEIGYDFNQRQSGFFERLGFGEFRLYVSGSNLLVWAPFKMWDPEMAGDGLNYPLQRVFNIGVKTTL